MANRKKQRLKLDPPSKLVDADGNHIATIHGLTVEWGDIGGLKDPPQTTEVGVDGGPGEGGEGSLFAPPADLDETERREVIDGFGKLNGRKVLVTERWMLTTAINAVWGHFVSVMKPRNDAPDDEQRKIIKSALDVATVAECKRAIDGCSMSQFHMGQNDRRKKYNRLSNILKGKRNGKTTREQIDMFLEIAESGGRESGVTSASHARVQQAKRDVLDGFEFPNDAQVQERANEAKAWLRGQGWKIERGDNGRPTFTPPNL